MKYTGILIGVICFLIIGLFHPIVIWAEYHFSKKIWPIFAIIGAFFLVLSLLCDAAFLSCICAITSASCFWSIRELFEQEKRVERGWFPQKGDKSNTVCKKNNEY